MNHSMTRRTASSLSATRAWKIGGMAKQEQEKASWGRKVLQQLAARGFEGVGSAAYLLLMVRLHDRWSYEKAREAERIGVKVRDLPNLLAFDASPAERRQLESDPAVRQRVEERLKLQRQVFAEIEAGELAGNQVRERVSALRKQHAALWPAGSQKLLKLRSHRATREKTLVFLNELKSSKGILLHEAGKVSQDEKRSLGELMQEIESMLKSLVAKVALLDRQSDSAAQN